MSTITTLTTAELDAVNGGTLYIKSPRITIGGNGGAGGTAVSGNVTGNVKNSISVSAAVHTGSANANGGNGGNAYA
jgi:hypothetical protein